MSHPSADGHAEIAAAVTQAVAARCPFFFAWLHADGTVRYAAFEATPLLIIQAAQAFWAACAVAPAVAPVMPQPIDPTV